ncbi:PspC domain-containing protein [Microbacterium oxydans]|uniref:PspC domain-containing protein n=1 Tax=Microbacterium oxydans TaxID=82380 RepID=UPI00226B0B96|nr:PspC domain-containing protein [Microbacterium oxydans]WAA65440.1 PspC domain-containing protein [Microbacterium oxydans]
MTIPTAPPPPADHAAPAVGTPGADIPRGADRFLLWVAGLGVARSEGWLGGVAAGIAARLRIDPLIVRGVLVVAALFGLPVIFLYAAAWALLPDVDGRVHVRDLLRRDYQPVQWGILAMAVIGLFPTAPLAGRLFGLGYDGWSALSLTSWVVGLVLVAGLLFLIVRAASRTPGASASDLPMASAVPTAPAASAPLGDSGTAEGADATLSQQASTDAETVVSESPEASSFYPPAPAAPATLTATPPAPPAPLPPGSQDPAALEAWRAQHAAWKEQDQAWRRQQQDVERAAREQLRRERQAEAAVFAAEAAERRRIRRSSNPRAGFAFAATFLGLAIITGAAVGLTSGGDALAGALGLLAAALILALGMIVAGAFRRRSGFLAFATVLTLIGGLVAGGFSTLQGFTLGWASIENNQAAHIRQPFGDLSMTLYPHEDGPRPIVVEKGTGTTYIYVNAGVELQLRATVDTANVDWTRVAEGDGEVLDSGVLQGTRRGGESVIVEDISAETGSPKTIQPVTIDQDSGDISITVVEPAKEEQR